MSESEKPVSVCYRHPDRETFLRCNRCDRLICSECAVLTPTGYRCKECVRGQQKVFNTAKTQDYILGILTALILGYIGGLIARFIGFFIIFIAPLFGVIIAEAVRKLIKKRRSGALYRSVLIAAIVGAVLSALPMLLSIFFGHVNLFGLIWAGVYIAFMPSSLYYRLAGIEIRR